MNLINKRTPPLWARRFVSWRLLFWVNDHYPTCWANMVSWKVYGSNDDWYSFAFCFDPYDYCGKYEAKP